MEASATPHEITKFTLQREDVITTKDSENPLDIAIPSLVAEDLDGVLCGYHLAILRAEKRHLFGPYLSWLHVSQTIRAHYEMHATGITRWAIGRKHFKTCPVPLPPLPEQKRIATYLDARCAAIDRAVETKKKQLDTLDALRKSIIQRAVTQGLNPKVKMKESGVDWLGRVPKHWLCESLKRATSRIQTGSTPPTSQPVYYEEGTIEWFAPECFSQTIKLRTPKKLINQQAFEDKKVRIFAPETVLFVGIGATIGKVAVLEKEGSSNQQIVGISCDHRMIGRFLAYQLKNYETIIPKLAQYTTLPILNQTKVGYLPVLRPPISEQQEICEFLDNKELELANVEKILNDQISTLTAYRKSLIHECVTGKRRISDADVTKVEAHV
ncbi:MAG: restriction endonuclease subunit S [Akkermansiaceae bacterium]|nr:restriction endonuclease subunit S [Akkermansiaceae bacterium]